jgi:hypothetical protein
MIVMISCLEQLVVTIFFVPIRPGTLNMHLRRISCHSILATASFVNQVVAMPHWAVALDGRAGGRNWSNWTNWGTVGRQI